MLVLFTVKFSSISSFGQANRIDKMVRNFTYPEARRDEAVADDFNGTTVNTQVRFVCLLALV